MLRSSTCLGLVLLVMGVSGCRSAPLGGAAVDALAPHAAARTHASTSPSPWVLTKASYERVGLADHPWVRTAESGKGGGGGTGDLAKAAQNPIASLISVPFQNNTNFGIGPKDRTQNVLNIQPVFPISLGRNWSLVTRAIIPVVHQPDPTDDSATWGGIGNVNVSPFVVAPPFGSVMVGVGPSIQFPAANDNLGVGVLGLGPSAVVVATPGKWVLGLLVSNVWGVEGDGSDDLNSFLAQYFINYNLPKDWYLTTSPIITANWNAPSDDRWTIPFGGGVGRIFKLGTQSLNANLGAYYNVEKPQGGADWQLRFQLTFLFPK